jgi:hypothetical protein
MKSRTSQRIAESWSGLHSASLNHIKPLQIQLRDGKAARA